MQEAVRGVSWIVCLALLGTTAVQARTPAVEARLNGLQEFILEFAQPMQNWDNAVRSDLVRVTPSLPATCSWDSDTRLACRSPSRFAEATRYRLDIAAGLKTQTGSVLAARALYVETARPTVSVDIERWRHGIPSIVLAADMPVDTAVLRSVLRLEMDAKPVELPELQRLPPVWTGDTRVRFGFNAPVEGTHHLLTLRITPGLRTPVGPLPGRQDEVLLRARINEPFLLRGVACAGRNDRTLAPARDGVVDAQCVPGQPVHLVFSRSLDAPSKEVVAQRVIAAAKDGASGSQRRDRSFEMESPFAEEGVRSTRAEWSNVGGFAPSSLVELRLDETIRSEEGEMLAPATVRIRLGDAQPHLRARQSVLVADGTHPPPLVEAVNVGTARLQVRGVGAGIHADAATAHSPRQGGVPQPVVSVAASRTLAEGGWVRWTPVENSESHGRRSNSVEFAAPAFDLLALVGRREVLAWANEWDRDAPVADAEIELLWLDPGAAQPRVIARGRTGTDGAVLLHLPDDLVVPEPNDDDRGLPGEDPQWLLRAVEGTGKRAVLPLGEVGPYETLGRAMRRGTWGVSDRPLYHAGDTVHYRLWQREVDDARLRAPHAVRADLAPAEPGQRPGRAGVAGDPSGGRQHRR